MQLVADYNQAADPDEHLQGVQLDIEPYVDPSFWNDVDTSLKNYLDRVESSPGSAGWCLSPGRDHSPHGG